jgi:hypothetical protein
MAYVMQVERKMKVMEVEANLVVLKRSNWNVEVPKRVDGLI